MIRPPLSNDAKSCILGMLGTIGLAACLSDSGILGTGKAPPVPPLTIFTGIAQVGEGTGVGQDKFSQIKNLRIALVWQFAGLKAYRNSHEEPLFSAAFPLLFTGKLQNPPPPDVLDHHEVAIGGVWLYADTDRSGRLDRLIHPELAARNVGIDSMAARFDSLVARIRTLANRSERKFDVRDTFSILVGGAIVRRSGGRADTIWHPHPRLASELWADVIRSQYRILQDLSPWEAFLVQRKKMDDRVLKTIAEREGSLTVEFSDRIRLRSNPGTEAEFAALLEASAAARMEMFYAFEKSYVEGMNAGWHDYPYLGDPRKGEDWVFGRSRRWLILYLRDPGALRQLLEAEISSSFILRNLGDLHAGYNLLHCDDQYRCEARSFRDTLVVEFGESENFFNPPSSPPEKPVSVAVEKPVPEDSLLRVEGSYAFLPFRPVHVVARDGALWAEVPDAGLFRFSSAGGQRYFNLLSGIQMKFILDSAGRAKKLFAYVGGEQGIGWPIGEAAGWASVRDRARALAEASEAGPDRDTYARISGHFEAGMDTVRVGPSDDESGVEAKLPGLASHVFFAAKAGGFASRHAEIGLRFETARGGSPTNLVVNRDGAETWYPNLDSRVFDTADSMAARDPASWGGLDSAGGSAPDRFLSHDGRARYGCASDGKYLQAGDGLLDTLARRDPGDSISLVSGGDRAVFRITGRMGGVVTLELSACGSGLDAAAKTRLRFRAGPVGGPRSDVPAADRWVKPGKEGTPIRIGPFRVTADPYLLEVTRLRTAEPERVFAFDGYRLEGEEAH
jgi:hypothetical protein